MPCCQGGNECLAWHRLAVAKRPAHGCCCFAEHWCVCSMCCQEPAQKNLGVPISVGIAGPISINHTCGDQWQHHSFYDPHMCGKRQVRKLSTFHLMASWFWGFVGEPKQNVLKSHGLKPSFLNDASFHTNPFKMLHTRIYIQSHCSLPLTQITFHFIEM